MFQLLAGWRFPYDRERDSKGWRLRRHNGQSGIGNNWGLGRGAY